MTLTPQQKQQPALYPGMDCEGIEFFTVEGRRKFISEGKVACTSKLPFGIVQLTNEEIKKDPLVEKALFEWFPESEFERQNKFLECRYGGLDFSADFENNSFKEGDYWDCPNRANCKFDGLICKKPSYNGVELNPMDINLMKLLSTTLTNETIAATLNLAFGSFHKFKQSLYAKLGNIQTKQEVALIAKSLNLI